MIARLHAMHGIGVSPAEVAVDEAVDHRLAEAALVVEDVMRDAERLGHAARVVDVLPGAARALAVRRVAVIVELQGDADDVVAFPRQQRGHDGGIDAARHGDDDARLLRARPGRSRLSAWLSRVPSSSYSSATASDWRLGLPPRTSDEAPNILPRPI